jgi:type 1 glutamine amidotransferase
LAKSHGFKCTVVFGVDANGHIEAGSSNLPGIEALKNADLLVIFARFLNPPAEQMGHLTDYLARGGPVVGLRTSSHAFKIPANAPTAKYSFDSKVAGYEKGFGHQILGNTWVGHHGDNHRQGTRIQLIPGQKDHPILRGVTDNAFCHAGGYVGIAADDFTVLANSQPLVSMDPNADTDTKKAAMPCTWTREYTGESGKKGRVFHSTQGASEDIVDASYRRLLINGILWAAGLEEKITPDLAIEFIGPYQPNTFKFDGCVQGVKPEDLAGFESPIMPKGK